MHVFSHLIYTYKIGACVCHVCFIEIHIFADINNSFFHITVQDMQGMVLNKFGIDNMYGCSNIEIGPR